MSSTATETVTSSEPQRLVPTNIPKNLPNTFERYEKLTREQCGHLRHFHNIASSLPGEWAYMGAQEAGQEWDTSYRYQLATMMYAAGAAHYHRLPAMQGMFKTLMRQIIQKMLRREVWGYWYLTSQSGIRLDPDLKELRKPWADPVVKENIMYSGHLLCMISLYTMLFADEKFDKEGSIVFDWNPMFWGMGPEKFTYTRLPLQDAIIKEMERENWLGVCCEPNLIFVICNQFPLLSMRYNDATDGTDVFNEVLPKYKAAWEKQNGFFDANGLFKRWYQTGQKITQPSMSISHTVWAMAFMSWNFDVVKSVYEATGRGFLHRVDDRINVHPMFVAHNIRKMVAEEGADPQSPEVVARAREQAAGKPSSHMAYQSPTFGYVSQWISEVGSKEDLAALLRHADRFLRPTWEHGGLYYARSEETYDDDGNYLHGDPYTGNSAIGYARLNVNEGQHKMWASPWTKSQVKSRPYVDGFDLGSNIDCTRGIWDEKEQAMIISLRSWNGDKIMVSMNVHNLPEGLYGVYVDGDLSKVEEVTAAKRSLGVDVDVDGNGVDVVVMRSQ